MCLRNNTRHLRPLRFYLQDVRYAADAGRAEAATANIRDPHALPPERASPQTALFDSSQTRLFD